MTVLGRRYPIPVAIAPSAMQRLASGEGELDVARAAVKANINLTLSSQATTSLEDVMSVATSKIQHNVPTDFWLQLYMTSDPERSVPLIKRAEGVTSIPKHAQK